MSSSAYTIVVGGVPQPDGVDFYRDLVVKAAHVVAADAGLELCRAIGRIPDVVVGDFDSASSEAVAWAEAGGARVVRLPAEKDVTDLDAALDMASAYATPVVITAAFRGRIDHTLAALGALVRAGVAASVEEPGWGGEVVSPGDAVRLRTSPGDVFSVIAFGEAEGVSISGAKYPLADAHVGMLSGLGVSNVATGNEVVLNVRSGCVLAVRWRGRAGYTPAE